MLLRSWISILASSSGVAAGCRRCAASDGCLQGLQPNIAQASMDCASFLDVTVTPSVQFITQYSTTSETDTVTIPTTLVETLYQTSTAVVHQTATVTGDTITTQLTSPAKRSAGAELPVYAPMCSNAYRFASACSCIGIKASTTTAAVSSTIVTVAATVKESISITETVDTTSVTIVDATVTQTTTDATFTAQATALVGDAQIYINGVAQNAYVGSYVSGSLTYGSVVTDRTLAMQMTLTPSGNLLDGTSVALGDGGATLNLQLFFAPPGTATARVPYICSLDANRFLSCTVPAHPELRYQFMWRSNNFIYVAPPSVAANTGYKFLNLKLT